MDEHNKGLVAGAVETAVAAAREGILSGKVKVHNYESDSSCPVK